MTFTSINCVTKTRNLFPVFSKGRAFGMTYDNILSGTMEKDCLYFHFQ